MVKKLEKKTIEKKVVFAWTQRGGLYEGVEFRIVKVRKLSVEHNKPQWIYTAGRRVKLNTWYPFKGELPDNGTYYSFMTSKTAASYSDYESIFLDLLSRFPGVQMIKPSKPVRQFDENDEDFL